jgi:carbon starvation protein
VKKAFSFLVWLLVAAFGASAYAWLAIRHAEPVNSGFLLVAAVCSYAIGYRFYSKWIAAKVLVLDDRRATPCEIHEDGTDFVKTNKWVVFGHHFAAISGPGPLVGPVLAAQFGFLPGSLWILIGVVLGGAVQDFVILVSSMRRDGRSLAQMVRDELTPLAGVIGVVAILSIMIILLAVLALVVVKALAESPWGIFTVAATIPIAMFIGGYLRWGRVGKVMEASVIGAVLLLLAVWGGKFVHEHHDWAAMLTLQEGTIAWSVIIYGLAASVLPVWLLLAPRDYLSTFMKLGTIFALAIGVLLVLPEMHMPAVTKFVDGSGLVVSGKLFPFCFITIACGAISGFHTLISSGITPKIITRESYARPIGYGAMCLESLVAIMAMIAACTLDPGVYLSMNVKGEPSAVVAKVQASGLTEFVPDPAAPGKFKEMPVTVSEAEMGQLAKDLGEKSLFGRTGGAATLAVGMAGIFGKLTQGRWLDLWYHFAIMFEALFILTTLDAGTRVGRYLLQDALGHIWKGFSETSNLTANFIASTLVVLGWGYFLIQGVHDPLGGVNSLWPIFGIANQLLASIALCLATTVILKTGMRRAEGGGRKAPGLALVTILPLVWLLTVTFTSGLQKIFHEEPLPNRPRVGFLQIAREFENKVPAAEQAVAAATGDGAQKAARKALRDLKAQIFNNRLDAVVTGVFLVLAGAIVVISVGQWLMLAGGRKEPRLTETPPVWLPEAAVAESRSIGVMGLVALGCTLAKEVSGQGAIERAEEQQSAACECAKDPAKARQNVYLTTTERQFRNIRRCC